MSLSSREHWISSTLTSTTMPCSIVRQCRAALPAHNLGAGVWSETAVVTEIAYDLSLVCLAARPGSTSRRQVAQTKISETGSNSSCGAEVLSSSPAGQPDDPKDV